MAHIFYDSITLLSVVNDVSGSMLSESEELRDDELLHNLAVGATATLYFRDLGPRVGWTVVRPAARPKSVSFLVSLD